MSDNRSYRVAIEGSSSGAGRGFKLARTGGAEREGFGIQRAFGGRESELLGGWEVGGRHG